MDEFGGASALTLLTVFLLRWCISIHSYSGENKPPMFGDYEAQRHWMEITYNVPVEDWYFNTTQNDLLYWGLDYPPLTAYHSKLCGHVAAVFDETYVALGASRGYESYLHKLFMRTTVIISDLFIYVPAVWVYFMCLLMPQNSRYVWRFLVLCYPGLILIDHAHFQYNGISLGLTIGAVAALIRGKDLLSSMLFMLAISFKQMSLYHALPFFFYHLGHSLSRGIMQGLVDLSAIGSVVLSTFVFVWCPFLTDINQFRQVLARLFPLARGVFEDKVSNVWCVVNVFFKLKNIFVHEEMALICLITTLISVLPSSIDLFRHPIKDKFILALINSSLSFFLFSFQVHEKSILLAAIPVALYFPYDPFACLWFLSVSTFSMLPLLVKDGLFIATLALSVFHIVITMLLVNIFPKAKLTSKISNLDFRHILPMLLFYISLMLCFILSLCSVFVRPPIQFPDLFPLLISCYSCGHFVLFFLYFNVKQIYQSHDCEKASW